jgi:hypothetical protein
LEPTFIPNLPYFELAASGAGPSHASGSLASFHDHEGIAGDLGGLRVSMTDPLNQNVFGQFFHAATHFSEPVGGGAFGPAGAVAEQGFFQYVQTIFLHPRQVEGALPDDGDVGAIHLFTQLGKEFNGRLILFTPGRFSLVQSHITSLYISADLHGCAEAASSPAAIDGDSLKPYAG